MLSNKNFGKIEVKILLTDNYTLTREYSFNLVISIGRVFNFQEGGGGKEVDTSKWFEGYVSARIKSISVYG